MVPLDGDIGKARALVIDGSPGSRTALVNMLHEFGIVDVSQERRAQDARRVLEAKRFDIVICEHDFEGSAMSGQDLMDDLRLAQLLPLATVVVMISGESGYAMVAEAAEAALDAYLIKPHTEAALRQRLLQARNRKRQLKDIFALIEAKAELEAAEMCQVRFETRAPGWLQAARIGAELWLHLGKPHAAQEMFDAILHVGAVPWARLGIARAQYDAGNAIQARRTLESLLNEQPGYADAYDVMGRVLLDQGLPHAALDAMRQATSLTPGSVARLVKHGLLAFYYGDPKEATEHLAKAARLGLNSRVFDFQGLVLLAVTQFDLDDRRGLAGSLSSLAAARAPLPNSDRLRRFEAVVAVLKALMERQVAEAVKLTLALIDEVKLPTFEFEAACNLLALLARVNKHELHLEGMEHHVQVLAKRFAVSRPTADLLARAIQSQPPYDAIIQDAYTGTCRVSEDAVSRIVAGAPGEAVQLLLAAAESSLNAKLIDLAMHTIDRHRDAIDDLDSVGARVQTLNSTYRGYGTQVHLSRANDPRSLSAMAKT